MICPNCAEPSHLLFRVTDVNRQLSQEQFSYYKCTSCGLIFLRPIPANLGEFYPNEYYRIPSSLAELTSVAQAQRHKLEVVQQYKTGGQLLEIGPSFGLFAYLAKTAGFQVDTIEMDAQCCQFLRETVGVNAIQSDDPAKAIQALGHYDVIALWQVIEHVAEPWELLKRVAEHLMPGGIVVVATPNPSSLQFKLFRSKWVHLDAPRHLQLIPVNTMIEYASRLGLRSIRKSTRDAESYNHNLFGWERSTVNLVSPKTIEQRTQVGSQNSLTGSPSHKTSLPRTLARRTIHFMAGMLQVVESREGLGSTYMVVLKRQE
jgi:2-polyprenyl-3-methyl-5-hydroxy-6-metoxy-1,4-benzoquinol methylase